MYIPDVNVHQPLLATQADLTANVSLTKGTLKIPELAGFVASSKKGKFDKKDNLVIDGSVYDINQAAQPYAKLELPWPDETFSASVSWVHKYAYVGKTDPNATLSVTEPSKVNDGSGNPKDAIAVSEVFVLKYTQAVESASFPVDGGVVPAARRRAVR